MFITEVGDKVLCRSLKVVVATIVTGAACEMNRERWPTIVLTVPVGVY